ncbi:MAG TPA: SDR family oxidoreductase [Thermoanaerobaculia bacterium]
MSGRAVLVTGATSGIGLETARALARLGAQVLVGARDEARGRGVVERIVREGGQAELVTADLSSFASVRGAAERISTKHPRLDVLIHNAGMVARRRALTADGHERTWETNFLGPFLLTRLLLPNLKSTPRPRIVIVSSQAHRSGTIDWADLELERGYRGFRAYANSKLALVLWTRELARRETSVASNAIHPGVIATNIWRAAPAPIPWILRILLPSSAKGAAPVVRLAADPEVEGVSGRYFDRFREAAPSGAAQNDSDARRLWEVAEKATAGADASTRPDAAAPVSGA